jgi:hypothetical protein
MAKKVVRIVSAIAILLASVFIACKGNAPTGTQKSLAPASDGFQWIKWGMTSHQIELALPNEYKNNLDILSGQIVGVYGVRLTDYCKADIDLSYDSRGECYQVNMLSVDAGPPLTGAKTRYNAFIHLASALTDKYGAPSEKKGDFSGRISSDDELKRQGPFAWGCIWKIGSTEISLLMGAEQGPYLKYTETDRAAKVKEAEQAAEADKNKAVAAGHTTNGL